MSLTEVIRLLKDNWSVFYFDHDTFKPSVQEQDEIIKDLNKLMRDELKKIDSLEEFSELKLEESKFVVLENEKEVQRFIKNSKYLLFHNEKIENLKISNKWADFLSKKIGISLCKHRLFLPYREEENHEIENIENPEIKANPEIDKENENRAGMIAVIISWGVFAILLLFLFGAVNEGLFKNPKSFFWISITALNLVLGVTFVKIKEKVKEKIENLILERLKSKAKKIEEVPDNKRD